MAASLSKPLMSLGSHSEKHLVLGTDMATGQPVVRVGSGETGQRPDHGIGQQKLRLRLEVLGQPALRGRVCTDAAEPMDR